MRSRKTRPELPRVVFTTGLTNHLKSRLPGAKGTRKPAGDRGSPRSRSDAGKVIQPASARTKAGPKLEGPITPEPTAGWVTRAEALVLLDLDDSTLVDLIEAYKLSRNWVEVYSKAEILALRAIVKALR
jgi:hypothetical protein